MNNNLSKQIESLLFVTASPQTFKDLSMRLGVSLEDVKEAITILEKSLEDHSIMLVQDNEELTLVTRPEYSDLIESVRKDELSKELSKSSAETLSIIAYCDGVSKAQVEFIRGVNASYSIRALSMRGLIEARGSGRSISYYPTLQMLEHFGVSKVEELPDYLETFKKIKDLLNQEQ